MRALSGALFVTLAATSLTVAAPAHADTTQRWAKQYQDSSWGAFDPRGDIEALIVGDLTYVRVDDGDDGDQNDLKKLRADGSEVWSKDATEFGDLRAAGTWGLLLAGDGEMTRLNPDGAVVWQVASPDFTDVVVIGDQIVHVGDGTTWDATTQRNGCVSTFRAQRRALASGALQAQQAGMGSPSTNGPCLRQVDLLPSGQLLAIGKDTAYTLNATTLAVVGSAAYDTSIDQDFVAGDRVYSVREMNDSTRSQVLRATDGVGGSLLWEQTCTNPEEPRPTKLEVLAANPDRVVVVARNEFGTADEDYLCLLASDGTVLEMDSLMGVYQGSDDLVADVDGRVVLTVAGGNSRNEEWPFIYAYDYTFEQSTPEPKITFSAGIASQKKRPAKEPLVVSGQLSYAPSGSRVLFQRKNRSGWTTLASASPQITPQTSVDYRFSVRQSPGRWDYRTVVRSQNETLVTSQVENRGFYRLWLNRVKRFGGTSEQFVQIKNPGPLWAPIRDLDLKVDGGFGLGSIYKGRTSIAPGAVIRIHPGSGRTDGDDIYLRRANHWNELRDRSGRLELKYTGPFGVATLNRYTW
ncbi:hypothetical protein GCM10027020_31890 [Nocardioides salsibiostraticola]